MAPISSLLRLPRVALVAIVAALWAGDVASASAGTAPDAMARMRRDGCCCPMPAAGGCCCEPTPSAEGPRPVRAIGAAMLEAISLEAGQGGGHCQCRSDDPVSPAPRRDQRGPESREDRATTATAEATPPIHQGRVHRPISTAPSDPGSPLYLRTSRLLI